MASARIFKRVWQIYVAHVFLFTIYLAEISYIATRFDNPLYAEEMGILDFLKQPDVTIVQALLLKFRPVNMDVLPLYIVLMIFLPLIHLVDAAQADIALALSVLLYALTWEFDWYLPAYPNGFWAFNPFAWQLLFVFGAWCALGGRKAHGAYPVLADYTVALHRLPRVRVLRDADLACPAAQRLHAALAGKLDVSDQQDRSRRASLRAFSGAGGDHGAHSSEGWPGLKSPWLLPVIRCGQHSLEIFCLGVFLAFAGHFVLAEVSGGAWDAFRYQRRWNRHHVRRCVAVFMVQE